MCVRERTNERTNEFFINEGKGISTIYFFSSIQRERERETDDYVSVCVRVCVFVRRWWGGRGRGGHRKFSSCSPSTACADVVPRACAGRLFGSGGTCMGCSQSIPSSDMVYRAQGSVYHIKCFVCVTCRHPLQPGDRYGLINGSLVCEQDYPKLAKGQGQVPLPARTTHKVGVGPGTRGA